MSAPNSSNLSIIFKLKPNQHEGTNAADAWVLTQNLSLILQAAVCGTNENKAQYVLDMLDRNCKFQEKEKMQRPLIHAVKQGNKKLVRVLLQNEVNVQAVDMRKLSALHFAVEFDQIEITELLLNELTRPLEFVRPKSMEMMNLRFSH
jgi:ankyrin repeat protein